MLQSPDYHHHLLPHQCQYQTFLPTSLQQSMPSIFLYLNNDIVPAILVTPSPIFFSFIERWPSNHFCTTFIAVSGSFTFSPSLLIMSSLLEIDKWIKYDFLTRWTCLWNDHWWQFCLPILEHFDQALCWHSQAADLHFLFEIYLSFSALSSCTNINITSLKSL